jgi:hypothetical protein
MMKNFRTYVYILLLILAISSSIYILQSHFTLKNEGYLELGLLGDDEKAYHYFDTNSSVVVNGSSLNWKIYLGNHYDLDKKVLIRIKIQNSSTSLPNDHIHTPSPIDSIVDIPLTLTASKSMITPIKWSIINIEKKNGFQTLEGLSINGKTYNVNILSKDARYVIIFELWVYNSTTNQYSFTWNTDSTGSASTYIWFRSFAPTYPRYPLNVYLPFIDSSNPAIDASGNNNDVTTNGYLVWRNDYGGYFYFNGVNTYMNRTSVSGLSPSSFSIAYWSRQTAASPNLMCIISLFGTNCSSIYVEPNTHLYFFKAIVSGVTYDLPLGSLDENWHHFVITFDGSTLVGYVDGQMRFNVPSPGEISKIDDSLFIGNSGLSSLPASNWFYGSIDEVRIYPNALTLTDIQNQYNSEKTTYIP